MSNVSSSKHRLKYSLSTVFTVIAIYILGQLAAALVFFTLKGSVVNAKLSAGQTLLVYLGLSGVVLACVYYILHTSKKGPRAVLTRLGIRKPTWSVAGYTLLGFGAYFVLFLISTIFVAKLGLVDLDQSQDIGFSRSLDGTSLVYAFIALVVLAPVAEEILFRGFLHRRLKTLTNLHISAVITSLLFAAAHWQLNVGIDTFVLSMVIIYTLEIKDNLLVAIGMHALKNSFAFLLLFVL